MGWIESEPCHPFSTTTDNWTWTWFGAHIFHNDIRLLIFWNKKTTVKLFLYKPESNVNVFKSRSKYFSFNGINKLVLYYQCTVGAPVWSAKACMYLPIELVLLKSFYRYLISPSVESYATVGLIYTL